MAEVKWIKITTDMFDNRKIKYLRKLPDGNSIVLIWVMLLTMAGRCNSGGMIFLTENIPYTTKMLSDELGFEETTVQLAIRALEQLGMVQTGGEGFLRISSWEEHQNIEGMEKIRESKRLAQARWRAKQKAIADVSTVDSTEIESGNAEEEKKEEKEEEKESIYTHVVDYLNEKAGTKYRASSAKTKSLIHAREAEGFTLDDFKTVIDRKCTEWLETDWEKFLRPETLFGTKFEGYLNGKAGKSLKQAATSQQSHICQSPVEDDLAGIF